MRTRLSTWAKAVLGIVTLTATIVVLGSTPAEAADACGNTIYKSDGTPWTCTFADDFTGTALDRTKWHVQTTAESSFSQGECFVDSPKNIAVSGGQLSLSLKRASYASTCVDPKGNFKTKYTSGSISTYGGFNQTYGRWEIRATFPNSKVAGQQSSVWMWPVTNSYGIWPYSGEIDIAEWYGKYYDRLIPYLHYAGQWTDPDATNNYCLVALGQPHTLLLEWNTMGLTISYDGKVCISDQNWLPAGMLTPKPFDKPFLLALSQLLGTGANKPVYSTPSTSTMRVDYVRVWS